MVERKEPVWPWLASLALHITVLPLLLGAWCAAPDAGRSVASVPPQTPLTVRLSVGDGKRPGPSNPGERQGSSPVARERANKPRAVRAVRRPRLATSDPNPSPRPEPAAPAKASPRLPEPQDISPPASHYPQAPARSSHRGAHPQHGDPTAAAARGGLGMGDQALVWIEAPVLLKGPREIPVPEFLQDRPGHFKLALRCAIGADASSQVSVMDSCGVVALDESVQESFTGLRWYPGERNGVPVALTVRLIIEGSWEAGETAVDWGFRVPQAHF